MARVRIASDAEFDTVTPAEHVNITTKLLFGLEAEKIRGIKHMRLPQLQGIPSGGALVLGQGSLQCGPDQGFIWSVRRLSIGGLTAGTAPDVMNVYFNSYVAAVPVWQLNGNNFSYTFGRLEMTMYPGDTLVLANSGALTATGTVTLAGEVVSVPAEQTGKLA